MDWASKTFFQWDWETLELFSGREGEVSRSAQETNLSIEGVCSSGGGASSALELGNWSSKSSISTAIDSLSMPEKRKPGVNSSDSTERTLQCSNIRYARVENCGSPHVSKADLPGELLTGLKLGRTFFDDIGSANNIKNLSSSTSMGSSIGAAKRSRVSHSNLQNFYCQVEGCNVDLTAAKNYHRKHRVCENHTKSPKVIIAGQVRRFCQQCSRFHDLSEFDQTKRSCRKRLTDHNARRRKPQPATISFASSTLPASFYDDKHQMNFVVGQAPTGHVATTVSSTLDGAYSFNLLQHRDSWIESIKAGGINGQLQFSSMTHNTPTFRSDLDRLLSFKGITAEVLDQDLEAYVLASSNLDGAPDLRHALSLLSNNTLGPALANPTSHIKFVNMKDAGIAHPSVNATDPTTGILQDEQPTSNSTMLSFDLLNNSNRFQEFQLLKTPYQASLWDATLRH